MTVIRGCFCGDIRKLQRVSDERERTRNGIERRVSGVG